MLCRDLLRQMFHTNGGRTTAHKPEVLGPAPPAGWHPVEMPSPPHLGTRAQAASLTVPYPWTSMPAAQVWPPPQVSHA